MWRLWKQLSVACATFDALWFGVRPCGTILCSLRGLGLTPPVYPAVDLVSTARHVWPAAVLAAGLSCSSLCFPVGSAGRLSAARSVPLGAVAPFGASGSSLAFLCCVLVCPPADRSATSWLRRSSVRLAGLPTSRGAPVGCFALRSLFGAMGQLWLRSTLRATFFGLSRRWASAAGRPACLGERFVSFA